jgi:putative methionine-R-sulfoxide reductase with GAF domain
VYNEEKPFMAQNYHLDYEFKCNFTGVTKRPDKPVLKSVCTKSREVSKTDIVDETPTLESHISSEAVSTPVTMECFHSS